MRRLVLSIVVLLIDNKILAIYSNLLETSSFRHYTLLEFAELLFVSMFYALPLYDPQEISFLSLERTIGSSLIIFMRSVSVLCK